MTEHFSENKSGAVVSTNLDAVIVDTDGASLETRDFKNVSVFVSATVSAAAGKTATVNIEGSHNGSFDGEEVNIDTISYVSGASASDIYPYSSHLPFMRSTATSLSGAAVTVVIAGGN